MQKGGEIALEKCSFWVKLHFFSAVFCWLWVLGLLGLVLWLVLALVLHLVLGGV